MKVTTNSSITARPSMWMPKSVTLDAGPKSRTTVEQVVAATNGRMCSSPARSGAAGSRRWRCTMARTKRGADGGDADLGALVGQPLAEQQDDDEATASAAAGMSQALVRNQFTAAPQPFMTSTSSRSIEWRLR